MNKPKTMNVNVSGELLYGITPKDLILGIIKTIGTGGGAGHVIEYTGKAIEELSMENRMTVCNMSIEGGARAGMIAPDDTTFNYIKSKNYAPKDSDWEEAEKNWRELYTDKGAKYDSVVTIDAEDIEPYVSWGTNPSQVIAINELINCYFVFANYCNSIRIIVNCENSKIPKEKSYG